jgi:hypothetical protein
MSDLSTCLLKHWVHSHEEDTPEVRVYRPADYSFPPSRGRMGFAFREGGELIYHGIAPADGSLASPGRWSVQPPNQVRIEVDNERIEPFTWEIISCSDDKLTVKR